MTDPRSAQGGPDHRVAVVMITYNRRDEALLALSQLPGTDSPRSRYWMQ